MKVSRLCLLFILQFPVTATDQRWLVNIGGTWQHILFVPSDDDISIFQHTTMVSTNNRDLGKQRYREVPPLIPFRAVRHSICNSSPYINNGSKSVLSGMLLHLFSGDLTSVKGSKGAYGGEQEGEQRWEYRWIVMAKVEWTRDKFRWFKQVCGNISFLMVQVFRKTRAET